MSIVLCLVGQLAYFTAPPFTIWSHTTPTSKGHQVSRLIIVNGYRSVPKQIFNCKPPVRVWWYSSIAGTRRAISFGINGFLVFLSLALSLRVVTSLSDLPSRNLKKNANAVIHGAWPPRVSPTTACQKLLTQSFVQGSTPRKNVKMDARRQPDQSRKNVRPGSEFSRFKNIPPYATSLTFTNRSSRIPRHLIPALIPHDDAISWGGHPFLLFGFVVRRVEVPVGAVNCMNCFWHDVDPDD